MVGVAALVLASVKIAKNAQLVAETKYINFGIEVFRRSYKFYKNLV